MSGQRQMLNLGRARAHLAGTATQPRVLWQFWCKVASVPERITFVLQAPSLFLITLSGSRLLSHSDSE